MAAILRALEAKDSGINAVSAFIRIMLINNLLSLYLKDITNFNEMKEGLPNTSGIHAGMQQELGI